MATLGRFVPQGIGRSVLRSSFQRFWTCKSCREALPRPSPRRNARSSSTTATSTAAATAKVTDDKPFYITSPIFYVNADPHIGHLYTLVICDILKRWQVLKGRRAIFCTGTDEHGMKVQRAAERAGVPPREFCDRGAAVFRELAECGGIEYDHFVRTTDGDHAEVVQYVWSVLVGRGYIYESKHEGWYSVADETFYPEARVHLIVEPSTGRKIMASMDTGAEVEWTSEINYKFRLSQFQEFLRKLYESNPDMLTPPQRRNWVAQEIAQGLMDISISRPAERLKWGIPVPEDPSQTIYVWFDALMNYLTKAGYPWAPGSERQGGWPADMQVIGKDIVRFHAIYWPAFLEALSLPQPKQIVTHGHWLLGDKKMSKSTGNVVNPFFSLSRFGKDVIRFYLARNGRAATDTDYSNYHIIGVYKKDLQSGIGNLLGRIVKARRWNVREAVEYGTSDDFQRHPSRQIHDTPLHKHHIKQLKALPSLVDTHMSTGEISRAVFEIKEFVAATNSYMTDTEPWKHGPTKEEANLETRPDLNTAIFILAESMRLVGILLQPIVPDKAAHLLEMLGVSAEKRTFQDAKFKADATYGVSTVDLSSKRPLLDQTSVLFPPLDVYE